MSDIFISYNRESEAVVRVLANDFEALGHDVWFDQDLSGGQAWWAEILETVRNCDLFVFALAPESLGSTACEREYRYADDLGKPILPVLVAEGISTSLLPPALSAIQIVDYRDQDDRNAAFRLARAVTTLPPSGPLPDPLPSPPDMPVSYLGGLTERIAASTLALEEQSVLVLELKGSLSDSETMGDARTLLQRLRKRRDLFAAVRDEIDSVLANTRPAGFVERRGANARKTDQAQPVQPTPPDVTPTEPEPDTAHKANGNAADTSSAAESAATASDAASAATSWQQRLAGAFLLSALLAAVGAALAAAAGFADWYIPAGFSSLAGALTGLISGTHGKVLVTTIVGMVVGIFLWFVIISNAEGQSVVGGWIGAFLGAIVGVILKKEKSWT